MHALPSVAVCVPTFNQCEYLPATIASALTQNYAGEIEVWVSDDASTDDTRVVLGNLREEHPQLHLLMNDINEGIATNASKVLAAPSADFLVRLDSDDLLAPGYVSSMVDILTEHPDAGYGHCSVALIDARGESVGTRELVRKRGFQESDDALRSAVRGYRVAANIVMFRRQALSEANYYRGGPNYGEDYDLSIRLADAGWGNVYLPERLASYRTWTDDGGPRSKRKLVQLEGYISIFNESLEPAFVRRQWSTRSIASRRRRLALTEASVLGAAQYDESERTALRHALIALAPASRSVRFNLFLRRHGGNQILDSYQNAGCSFRALVRRTILRLRTGGSLRRTAA